MESLPAANGYAPSLAEDPALGLSHRAKMEILFAVMLGLFLGALDQTIVGPALPTIVTQLSGNDYYVWAITIYLLTSTISVPFWGKLSDIYGRKPIFMIGIVIFLIGSALSGLSQNMGMLILFRGIQGIGAGSLFPVALAVIGDLFTPQERGKYQGLFGAVFGIAFVAGPLIGGFLTENVGWHWIFYVNIPIGIIALVVIQRLLPTVKTPSATRNFDLIGGSIFTVAMVFLLVGLTNKQFGEWTDPTVGGFILVGIVGTLVFIWAEARAKEPIIPLGLWQSRTYSATMVSVFFAAFAFFGAIVFLPRWFQVVEGFSPTNSGLAALPLMIGLIFSSIVSGLIVSRTGRYRWLIVGSVAVMGFAVLLMTQLTKDTPVEVVWLWMFIAGLGVGPTFSVPTIVIQNAVPFRQLGVATSNLTFFRQIGGTIALAFVGTIFGTSFKDNLVPQLSAAGVPPQVIDGFTQASSSGSFDLGALTGVGDMGQLILAQIPAQFQDAIEPFIGADGRGNPRGLQPRDRPDVLARRGRRRRGAHRRGRDQGDPAPGDQQRSGAGKGRRCGGGAGSDRLTSFLLSFATPRWSPSGRRAVPGGTIGRDDRPARGLPATTPGAGHDWRGLRGGPRSRVVARRNDAAHLARRPRCAARQHAGGDRRHRRPLPTHVRTALDRRSRRLRRRLSASRGPLRPVHRRNGADADHRRTRRRRHLPPDVVAGRPGPEGGSTGQEGRGTPADPRPAPALLPGPGHRRSDRGRTPEGALRAGLTGRSISGGRGR